MKINAGTNDERDETQAEISARLRVKYEGLAVSGDPRIAEHAREKLDWLDLIGDTFDGADGAEAAPRRAPSKRKTG